VGKPHPLGWGYTTTWASGNRFINPSFAEVFVAWGGAPERGFFPSPQMSRWGDTPLLPPPRDETINPAEGVTDETPTMKTQPLQDGEGVIVVSVLMFNCRYLN